MSTERFMSRICKSPGRFALAMLLGAWLALSCLLPAAARARAGGQTGALSLSSGLTTTTAVLNKAGVSVVRLDATYSATGHASITCTGLGVLIASQMIAPQSYKNWVLADGNLISTKMTVCGQSKGADLTLSALEIWASDEYAGATPFHLATLVCQPLPANLSVICGERGITPTDVVDTVTINETAITFESAAGEPSLELAPAASSNTLVNIGLIKAAGGGAYPSKALDPKFAPGGYLHVNVVGSPAGNLAGGSATQTVTVPSSGSQSVEGGTPELDDQGQLVGMWVNNGVGGYTTLSWQDISRVWQRENVAALTPATAPQGCSVASCWVRGMNEYNQGNFSTALPYLNEASTLNPAFVGARTFANLAQQGKTPTSPQGHGEGDSSNGSSSMLDLLSKNATLLMAAGGVLVLIVLVLLVLLLRSRTHRRKLAEMEKEWEIAQQKAKQEVLQKQSQPAPAAPPAPAVQASQRPAPYCPNCRNPVQLSDSVCPHCRYPLAPTASGLGVRLMGNTPVGSAPLPPLAPPPPPSISEQPTVMFAPGVTTPVNGESSEITGKRSTPVGSDEPTIQVRGHNLSLAVGTRTDPGLKRKHKPNEDSLFAYRYDTPRQQFGLFVVADGMGGHANGQDASRLAIQTMINFMLPNLTNGEIRGDEALLKLMGDGVQSANQAVHGRNQESHADMGTTMTAALVIGATAYVANVGDSRTYLYRRGQGLSKVTHDHSVVASLVDAGIIKPDDIYTHPKRNQIYRSLGEKPVVEVDTFQVSLLPGDKLLLCSDGLWDMVRDPLIQDVLGKTTRDPDKIGQDLIKAALDGGGEDNVSVIVAQFSEAKEGSTVMSGVQLLAKPETVNVPNVPVL